MVRLPGKKYESERTGLRVDLWGITLKGKIKKEKEQKVVPSQKSRVRLEWNELVMNVTESPIR